MPNAVESIGMVQQSVVLDQHAHFSIRTIHNVYHRDNQPVRHHQVPVMAAAVQLIRQQFPLIALDNLVSQLVIGIVVKQVVDGQEKLPLVVQFKPVHKMVLPL